MFGTNHTKGGGILTRGKGEKKGGGTNYFSIFFLYKTIIFHTKKKTIFFLLKKKTLFFKIINISIVFFKTKAK